MIKLPHLVKIKDVRADVFIDAEVGELTGSDIAEYHEKWKPEIVKLNQDIFTSTLDFPWDNIWYYAKNDQTIGVYGLKCKGKLEAMLEVSLIGESNEWYNYPKDNDLIYLKHLQTAPWNHSNFRCNVNRKYSGAGTAMLQFSKRLSVSLGFNGRFGLHSADSANTFYRECPLVEHVTGTYYESTS